jgi:alkylated DNA repair dioxygenase AlkB
VKTILNDDTGSIQLYPAKFSNAQFLNQLDSYALRQESIKLFGKEVKQPRLSALYGRPNTFYKYSGKLFEALPWSGELKSIAIKCSELCETDFNTALLNYYRSGQDSMGLHADNERELGRNPTIASLSFGATRKMVFRNRESNEKLIVPLAHGDLLIMKGALQHHWKHELPKGKRVEEARLNITFRSVRTEK